MENWLDYIDYLLFRVNIKTKEFKDNLLEIKLDCGINFQIYLSTDANLIFDILYWSDYSNTESEEFGFYLKEGGVFSLQNKETVSSIFDTPINTGWTDYYYYFDDELIKIQRYEGTNTNRKNKSFCGFRINHPPPEFYVRKFFGMKTYNIEEITILAAKTT